MLRELGYARSQGENLTMHMDLSSPSPSPGVGRPFKGTAPQDFAKYWHDLLSKWVTFDADI